MELVTVSVNFEQHLAIFFPLHWTPCKPYCPGFPRHLTRILRAFFRAVYGAFPSEQTLPVIEFNSWLVRYSRLIWVHVFKVFVWCNVIKWTVGCTEALTWNHRPAACQYNATNVPFLIRLGNTGARLLFKAAFHTKHFKVIDYTIFSNHVPSFFQTILILS